ncbi:membrane protein, partial [Vibrio caribbeanicus ATCC BAA-2122]
GTPGYGSPIFGMHYYTWAFVLFGATVLGVALLLILWNEEWNSQSFTMSGFGRLVCLLAITAVALNFVSTFAECGPYECPADPVSYWLFS